MKDISHTFCEEARASFADIVAHRVSNFGGRVQLYRPVTKALPLVGHDDTQLSRTIDELVDQLGDGTLTSDAAASQFIRHVDALFNPETPSTAQ